MKNYIALLPEEVISKIISYSYSPQSKELCEDVRSYKKTEAYLKKNYRKDYKHEADAMGWLANNIYRFLNDDLPTIYGYQPSFINIFKIICCYRTMIRCVCPYSRSVVAIAVVLRWSSYVIINSV